jgi:glycosyltransferase involved in cell wall biosynthesis/ADP-heptose:LPS heptosyltransferase/SAM-dependent methyltransferase
MRLGFMMYGHPHSPGGGFLYNRMVVDHLLRQGHEVAVISLPWGKAYHNLEFNFSRALPDLIQWLGLELLLQDEHVYSSCWLLNRRLRARFRIPIVALVHHLLSSETPAPWPRCLKLLLETPYARAVDGFIFNSQATRRTVEKLAGSATPAVVAFPGADRLHPAITPKDIVGRAHEPGPLRLVFLGNLVSRKGLHTLLTALSRLSPSLWQLEVVGSLATDPEYVRQLQRQLETLKLTGKVRLAGRVPDETVAAKLARSHLMVMPSYYEGLGIVYLEGMGFGLPAIATPAGGALEVVTPGVDGFFAAPDDAQTISDYILKLSNDRDLLARMGLAAQARFLRHPTWEEGCSRIHQFLLETAARRAGADSLSRRRSPASTGVCSFWTIPPRRPNRPAPVEKDPHPETDFFEQLVARYMDIKHTLFPPATRRRIYFDRMIHPLKKVIGFSEYRLKGEDLLKRLVISHQELSQHLKTTDRDKILISYHGGLGDTLFLSWLGRAARRQFPDSRLFLMCRSAHGDQLKDMTRLLNDLVVIKPLSWRWKEFLDLAVEDKLFDLVLDCRYATRVTAVSPKYQELAHRYEQNFLKYSDNFDEFPVGNQVFSKKYGKSLLEMVRITSGLDPRSYDLTFSLSSDDFAIATALKDRPFITISTGVDQEHAARKDQPSTKQWPQSYWEELVHKITALGILVVQLGTKHDQPLPLTLNLLGLTTLREAAALIKQARCHVSVEGGLVWLAKAVGARSVVLFGPTDKNFFGLPENRNLAVTMPCAPCWWRTENWMSVCPEGYGGPRCLEALTPDLVLQEVQSLVTEEAASPAPRLHLQEVEFFSPRRPNPQGDRGDAPPAAGAGTAGLRGRRPALPREHIFARDQARQSARGRHAVRILGVGAGLAAVSQPLLEKGGRLTLAAPASTLGKDKQSWAQGPAGAEVAFNNLYNLSFPSGHFDVVVILSDPAGHDCNGFALREALRVLKPQGRLILTFPFASQSAGTQAGAPSHALGLAANLLNAASLVELLRDCNIQGEYSEAILREKYLGAMAPPRHKASGGQTLNPAMGGLVIAKEG